MRAERPLRERLKDVAELRSTSLQGVGKARGARQRNYGGRGCRGRGRACRGTRATRRTVPSVRGCRGFSGSMGKRQTSWCRGVVASASAGQEFN